MHTCDVHYVLPRGIHWMGEKTALTCLVTFIPLLIASLGFPSFASTPTAFIHHPPPTTISSNLLHPSSSLSVVYQTTQWNLHPGSSLIDRILHLHLLHPSSPSPSSPSPSSRISTAFFISISCDQRRLVLQVFLSLLCFFILLLFHSLRFSCKKCYGELNSHNARLSIIIRLAPPLQVWVHRTYFLL